MPGEHYAIRTSSKTLTLEIYGEKRIRRKNILITAGATSGNFLQQSTHWSAPEKKKHYLDPA